MSTQFDSKIQLWGKWRGVEEYHPLLCHLIDVANVFQILFPRLARSISGADGEALSQSRWLTLIAALHDIGKSAPAFEVHPGFSAAVIDIIKRRLAGLGLPCPSSTIAIPHGTITACVLPELLIALGLDPESAKIFARVVGGHHGNLPSANELALARMYPYLIGEGPWTAVRIGIVNDLARLFFVLGDTPPRSPGGAAAIVLAGLVTIADWIGSIEAHFPYAVSPVTDPASIDLERYCARSRGSAVKALRELHWLVGDSRSSIDNFAAIFPGFAPNDLQLATSEIAGSLEFPALVLIEAPMGEGKTEAAMYLAATAATRLQQPGCYFALPTQATSNQMFTRVREFLERTARGDVNLQLLHGHASLSAEFELLRNRVPEAVPLAVDQAVPDRDRTPTVFAAEWFTYRKRGLLAPYGVGTIDQALLAVLKTPHFFVRIFGLTGKTVIIDEVHAYDAYMSTLLERLLEWLGAVGSPVVLLSATLPAAKRDALLRAYMRGLGTSTELSESSPYPRITWVGPNGRGSRTILASERTRRELVVRSWADGRNLGVELSRLLAEGGCAAVVCNTVGRAQKVFATLAPFFPGISEDGEPELLLFHARYPFDERDRREKLALVRFGKPGFEVELGDGTRRRVTRPHRGLLVATQVIEQSLDLDFDVIVSDFAPIDLLLQRAGRLHRHDRGSRPSQVADRALLIVAPQLDERGVPRFGMGTEAVYHPHLLLRTWLTLQGRHSIAIPDDVEHLIELVYGDEKERPAMPAALHAYWEATEDSLMQKLEEFKLLAKRNCIPRPHDEDLLTSHNDLEEDNVEIHPSLQALTRISELPSVEVVVMDNEMAATFDPEKTPDRAQALLYLRRSVRIAHRALVPAIFKNPLLRPKGWRRSALLRHSRILRLDANGRIVIGNYTVSLDHELGIVIQGEA